MTVAALLGAAAAASLSAPAAALAACPTGPTTKAFLAFGDLADYRLIPDGGLESGGVGWALRDAAVESGNEGFFLNALGDSHALRVDAGGRAVSPPFCVDVAHPTFRFVMRQPGGTGTADLAVSVRYTTQDGKPKEQKLESLAGTGNRGWRPSPVFDLFEKLGFSDDDATTSAHVVVEAEDDAGASWRIDDVFVDPYKKR